MLGVIPAAAAVPGDIAGGFQSGCAGGLMNLDVPTTFGDLEADIPCTPSAMAPEFGTLHSGFYTLMVAVIAGSTMWGCFMVVRAYFGGRSE